MRAVGAGMLIGIAAMVRLTSDMFGALLFCVGLTTIFVLGLPLYTGACGQQILDRPKGLIKDLLLMLAGNLIGTYIMAICNMDPSIKQRAAQLWANRCELPWGRIMVASFMCGLLVQAAKSTYLTKNRMSLLTVPLCIMAFVLLSFDHSIASSFNMFCAQDYAHIPSLVLMILGNTLGAVFLAAVLNAPANAKDLPNNR